MQFKQVERNRLYFGQYQYCIGFFCKNASVLRELDPIKVVKNIQYRNLRSPSRHHWPNITEQEQHELIQVCDYLLLRQQNASKRTVTTHFVYVYTNDPEDFADLNQVAGITVGNCTQVNLCLAPNAVTLKNPTHSYRTFFRDRWLSDSELRGLRNYFENRPNQFRLSPGFSNVVTGQRMWLAGNHFVDHNEPLADVLINMAVPGVVKKTLPIVARN